MSKMNKAPEFYENHKFDPVLSAIGSGENHQQEAGKESSMKEKGDSRALKKKAGFYLSRDLLDRFTRKFYELKLTGIAIENKSMLIEAALSFALDDVDKGEGSSWVLKKLQK